MSKEYFRPPSPASSAKYQEFLHNAALKSGYSGPGLDKADGVSFILANADFIFDWEKNCFAIANDKELREKFTGKFDAASYEKVTRTMLSYAKQEIVGELQLAEGIKIYRPANPPAENSSKIRDGYYAYSPLRNILHSNDGDLIANQIIANFRCVLIDEIARKTALDQGLSEELYQRLQPKLSDFDETGFAYYLRDDCIVAGEKLFQVDIGIIAEYVDLLTESKENEYNIKTPEHFLYKLTADSDLLATEGLPKIEPLPFLLEGGNFIFCKDRNGENLMLMAVSDINYDYQENKFMGSLIRDSDGKIKKCPSYEELSAKMTEWGESQGCKVIIVERNLSIHPIESIYHLDTFCNVAHLGSGENILIIPEVADEIITEKSRASLIAAFGQDNIIEINEEERSCLCSNFIQFGNTILLTHPDTPLKFIEALNEKGFSVVAPPIILERNPSEVVQDGLRCHTMPKPLCQKPQIEVAGEPVHAL